MPCCQAGVEIDDEIDRVGRLARDRREIGRQQRACRLGDEIGRELRAQFLRIGEGEDLGVGLDEEVERIDDRELGDEVDLDAEFLHGSGKTKRASQLPLGSCCQFTKCSAGVTFSE
jgi:hypothetical protein